MNTIWRMAGRTTATIFTALLIGALTGVGCGGSLVDNRPADSSGDPSITLIASTETQTNVTNPTLKANGRDSLLLEATVKGLSQSVGFYIPVNYGVISGGSVGADGYSYFTADSAGVARATLVSSSGVGVSEVIAKSQHLTASIPVNFTFATLTLAPATVVFNTAGSRTTITATGATEPVSWASSDSDAVNLYPNGNSVMVLMHNMKAAVAAGTVTITATDADGQTATTLITITPSCSDAIVTISPASSAIGSTTIATSIAVTDVDRAGLGSVPVTVAYPNGGANVAVTLSENSLSPGFFQNSYTINCAGCVATDIVTIKYSDVSADCTTPKTVTTNFVFK